VTCNGGRLLVARRHRGPRSPHVTRNGGVGPRHRSLSTSPSRTTLAASDPGADDPQIRVFLDRNRQDDAARPERGPDGAVLYRMFLTGARRQQDKWRVIADGVAGPITAVAGTDGRLDLFAIGSEGRVLHRCTPNGTWPSKGEWQNLGGNFAGPVIAMPGDDAKIDLLAAASKGGVRHLRLDGKAQARPSKHWSDLGGKVARSLAAVSLKSGSLDIVGLAADGAVLHGRVKVGNGKLGPARWVNLGGQFQGVACGYANKGGLEMLTYAADRSLHRMTIEKEAAKGRWVKAGTLDSPQHDASRVEVAKRKSVTAPGLSKGRRPGSEKAQGG
jgi:hypothetical protein